MAGLCLIESEVAVSALNVDFLLDSHVHNLIDPLLDGLNQVEELIVELEVSFL